MVLNKILFFSSLLLLLTSVSCEKINIIETGDHSFSCYINGKLFVPKGSINLIDTAPLRKSLVFSSRNSYFSAKATDTKNYKIFFNIEDFDTGVYNLKQSDGNIYENQFNHAVVVAYISSNYDKKYLSKEGSGTVTFTDVSDTNVAGVFEFTLYNENDETDIIRVTKGKFND